MASKGRFQVELRALVAELAAAVVRTVQAEMRARATSSRTAPRPDAPRVARRNPPRRDGSRDLGTQIVAALREMGTPMAPRTSLVEVGGTARQIKDALDGLRRVKKVVRHGAGRGAVYELKGK
jgi:hypothetical protein